ncbi:MAG: N-acetyltransferase [Prolixibacteraceae bacterium]
MNLQLTVRKADATDLAAITSMEQACFSEESFSRRQLKYLITQAKADFLVSQVSDEITAFIVLLKRKTSRSMRIYSVAVSPAHRGKGLARLLLTEAEKLARLNGNHYLTLEVSEVNHEAVRLYLRKGFEVFGERPAYYKNGSKALLMRKKLG